MRKTKCSEPSSGKSSSDEDMTNSRASSGIGTMSVKSKMYPEDVSCKDEESILSSSTSQDSSPPTKEIIPVFPRHSRVFSRYKNTAKARCNEDWNPKLYDKISIAENDDKDFELFARSEERDHEEENELRVRDWHVMLENIEPSHSTSIESNLSRSKRYGIGKFWHCLAYSHFRWQRKSRKNDNPCNETEHDFKNTEISGKNTSDHEQNTKQIQVHETEDLSDCSSKEEGKPAKNTLKKTFTSLLSKIYLGKSPDGSSLTDVDSNCGSSSTSF